MSCKMFEVLNFKHICVDLSDLHINFKIIKNGENLK